MSCGVHSSEEVCECDFIQDSKQKKGKGKAESQFLYQCLKSNIHEFIERVAVQKEIKKKILYNNIPYHLKTRMAFFLSVILSSVGSIKSFNPEPTGFLLH